MQAGLPGWVKLAYGAGAGGWVIIDRVLLTWLYYFYVTAPDADTVAYMAPLVFSVLMLAGRAGAVVFTRYPEDQIKQDRTALRPS